MNSAELIVSFKNGNIITIGISDSRKVKRRGDTVSIEDIYGTDYVFNFSNINYMAVREHELQQYEMEKEKAEDTEA